MLAAAGPDGVGLTKGQSSQPVVQSVTCISAFLLAMAEGRDVAVSRPLCVAAATTASGCARRAARSSSARRKLALRRGRRLGSSMISSVQVAERDASWFAIRHPAVMRLLERELVSSDGDAFAAGLELACRVLGGRARAALIDSGPPRSKDRSHLTARVPLVGAPLGALRLDHHSLHAGMVAVRGGRCDRAMVRSIRAQISELPVVLTPREEDAVATVIAALIWSVLDASARSLDDTLVA